jgi:hypothetical protein
MVHYLLDMPWQFSSPIFGPSAPVYENICRECSLVVRILSGRCLFFIVCFLERSVTYADQMIARWVMTLTDYERTEPTAPPLTWSWQYDDRRTADRRIEYWNHHYGDRFRMAVRAGWAFRFGR